MSEKKSFIERYKTGDIPWDVGKPDFNLIHIVTKRPISPCKALDVGCGTGDNAIWLAQQEFVVSGCDISKIAIEKAKEKLSKAQVGCTFVVADFMKENILGTPFGLIFDRGCLHVFDSEEERKRFAKNAASHLEKGGLWLSIIGSADGPPRDPGPPRRTAREIVTALEPYFEILSLTSSHFESNRPDPSRAWICLSKKRDQ